MDKNRKEWKGIKKIRIRRIEYEIKRNEIKVHLENGYKSPFRKWK